jgi:regulatory protein
MDEPPNQIPVILEVRNAGHGRQRLIVLDDGREFLFSEEACERVGVTEGVEAVPALFEALDAAEHRVGAHEAALRLLSHRARSETEMRTRLAMRGVPPEAVDDEIERLRRAGLLDDEKFARAWVEDRKRTAPRGRRMLRYELLGRGIGPESVEMATRDVDDRETAHALARQKARTAPVANYDAFLAKVGGFLRRRGFDYGLAVEATKAAWSEVLAELSVSEAAAADDPQHGG